MLTFLGLKTFRAFEQVSVDLAPITVFVGPNNAGKSSIISALRILAQTAASDDFRIPLLLNGPMGDFGTYGDLVFANNVRRSIGIQLGATLSQRSPFREARLELNFAYRSQRREVILKNSAVYDQNQKTVLTTNYTPGSERHVVQLGGAKSPQSGEKGIEGRAYLMHFLVPAWRLVEDHMRKETQESRMEIRRVAVFADTTFREFLSALRSIEYLGPFRVSPGRTVLFSGERPTSLGRDGARTAHLLAADYLRKGKQKKRLLNRIIWWLKQAGIAKDIEVKVLSGRHFEVLVQHPATLEYENLADVGYGISQVLPVIAGGYNLSEGATLIVEEPEIHLHPRAQAELGEFFASLYEHKIQCILETHSEHLIVRLQRYVAEHRIKAKDILVYYVHAPADKKEVVKLRLADDGTFLDKWPSGFFDERLKEVGDFARASDAVSQAT